MWFTQKPRQQELNWKDQFPPALGTYISLPSRTLLWRAQSQQSNSGLYHFSSHSDTCNVSYCSDNAIHLMDYRYACILLADHNMHIPNPPTVADITNVCRLMKKSSYQTSDFLTPGSYRILGDNPIHVIDGIIISAKNGIHIILFDMRKLRECMKEEVPEPPDSFPLTITESMTYYKHPPQIDPPAPELHKRALYEQLPIFSESERRIIMPVCQPRLYITNASAIVPIQMDIPECAIEHSAEYSDLHTTIELETLGICHPNMHLPDPDIICTESKLSTPYTVIDWKDSFLPVYGSYIKIPSDTLLWRGYDTVYPALAGRPVYFGDVTVATEYAKTSSTHALGAFTTTRPLKVLDIRFLNVLLRDLFYGADGNAVQKTTVAFGLCSFKHQLRLMESIYKDSIAAKKDHGYMYMKSLYRESDFEQPGVRVAETSNDGWVMTFLGEVFDGIVDGFIAPQLISPYQVYTKNILHPELIVFNPVKSGIVQLNHLPPTKGISISELIRQQFPSPVMLRARALQTEYVGCAVGGSVGSKYYTPPPVEVFNDLLNGGHPDSLKQYREAIREGKKYRKRITFSNATEK